MKHRRSRSRRQSRRNRRSSRELCAECQRQASRKDSLRGMIMEKVAEELDDRIDHPISASYDSIKIPDANVGRYKCHFSTKSFEIIITKKTYKEERTTVEYLPEDSFGFVAGRIISAIRSRLDGEV